jgi:hypothetical protein
VDQASKYLEVHTIYCCWNKCHVFSYSKRNYRDAIAISALCLKEIQSIAEGIEETVRKGKKRNMGFL